MTSWAATVPPGGGQAGIAEPVAVGSSAGSLRPRTLMAYAGEEARAQGGRAWGVCHWQTPAIRAPSVAPGTEGAAPPPFLIHSTNKLPVTR